MSEKILGIVVTLSVLSAFSVPATAIVPIDLSQLCGVGDCVVANNTTIGSTSGPLQVTGNFTVNSGVVLAFLVDTHIQVDGDLNLMGMVGAPGNGGNGGHGGDPGQPGGAGEDAPPVVNGRFDVRGNVTLGSGAVAVVDGGSGGSGGAGSAGESGGAGGRGGYAGSLTFNTCNKFTSHAGAQLLANGGAGGGGGIGQVVGTGGHGGAGGEVVINAKGTIAINGSIIALGGNGGGGAGSDGSITIRSTKDLSVTGTLNSGNNTPIISPYLSSIDALDDCPNASPGPGAGHYEFFRLLRRP